ncbi:MAG TPA: UDP-3-O-(3-hydroxymyristoyl)glucosamine N-acyltransferase [Tepidisphaeraceae bacterium]|jgi:UDP-3-O-[3-hydroxymyristoyl] glucosamine N-acyltransferase
MPLLQTIADALNVPCPAHGNRDLRGANSLRDAGANELSVLSADKFARDYASTNAGAVIAGRKLKFAPRPDVPTLMVDDPELALVTALELLAPPIPHPPVGVHATAVVSPSAVLETGVAVGPHVVIGAGSRVGRNTRLHAGVVIGDHVSVGGDCTFFPHVVLRERVTVGDRVILHANCVIGTDGFGYRWDGARHAKIPQIGTVVIEDDVEIGSGSCIDRAKFFETRVGRGTKIDNLVQLGHNVRVGQHAIICGQVGVAGSVTIGNGVVLGGAAVVNNHVTIGDAVMAAGNSAIADDIAPNTTVSGIPALPHRQTLREQGSLRRLPEMLTTLRKLQEEVEALKAQLTK